MPCHAVPCCAPLQLSHLAPSLVKGEDTMDVWFDSGSSWAGVVRAREGEGLTFPADLYLEGSDQHRGESESERELQVPRLRARLACSEVSGSGQALTDMLVLLLPPLLLLSHLRTFTRRLVPVLPADCCCSHRQCTIQTGGCGLTVCCVMCRLHVCVP
jgi:hypothetical protein